MTGLAGREEYFPVLLDAREGEPGRSVGLALGRFDGRRIPMETARDEGLPQATLPARRPGLKVLLTSGYSGSNLRNGDRLKEGEHFIAKPYRSRELARVLAELLEGRGQGGG